VRLCLCHSTSVLLVTAGLSVTSAGWAQRRIASRRPSSSSAQREDNRDESGVVVRGQDRRSAPERDGRSGATVSRREMDERAARSAPEALRYVSGVSVQQTAHGQASPYVRGVTGQQVLLLFDGVRLNNGLYRQGPNQYFFTVDAGSVDRIDVSRGSASVLYGSDALGGVLLARPIEPRFDPSVRAVAVRARAFGSYSSADQSPGGRAEVEGQFGSAVAVVAGVGYRVAGLLRGGPGGVRALSDGSLARTPALLDDNATQRGTGFRELTFDGRLVWRVRPRLELVAAVYGYRQYDAPRTDLCPPTWASDRACMRFEEQFRTLAYGSLRGDVGEWAREVNVTASYQRAHERRRFDNPTGFAGQGWIDSVDTLGLSARAATPRMSISRAGQVGVTVRYGLDVWRDAVQSFEWSQYNFSGLVVDASRGQYVNGASYWYGGAFSEAEVSLRDELSVRAGARGSFAYADSPADPSSSTAAVSRGWGAFVARAGLEWRPRAPWTLFANIDQGFRPPNLDDLTSRQLTGPGFQLENPALAPERSTTYELGTRVRTSHVELDAWGYALRLDGAMLRAPRSLSDCTVGQSLCVASSTRLQLVNVREPAWVLGGEGALRVRAFGRLDASATVSFAWGESPSPLEAGMPRLPMSRVPPLQGTVEARWSVSRESCVGAAFRWAADQTRLAYQDTIDPRIPSGGTPGYALLDLRVGARVSRHLRVNAVLENVFDTAWRVHGSSINGPGRGLLVQGAVGW
jgi:outer membrane receptor protein involved in Fe transport